MVRQKRLKITFYAIWLSFSSFSHIQKIIKHGHTLLSVKQARDSPLSLQVCNIAFSEDTSLNIWRSVHPNVSGKSGQREIIYILELKWPTFGRTLDKESIEFSVIVVGYYWTPFMRKLWRGNIIKTLLKFQEFSWL